MLASQNSSVFISYARSDGSNYASWLRRKLQEEHPDIDLWQDIISERAGRDWWLQITDALNHIAYMVVVATPDATRSEFVRKEWRYARQQGVCVLPVKASEELDFDSLPRWMKTAHFADLKVKEQWDVFVSDLYRPCRQLRVPFMVEDLPEDFVARPVEFNQVIGLLLDKRREQRVPVAITTALRGAGGFGKTMLARAVCHDSFVQEAFDDGILWVTLGEKVDSLVGKVTELTSVLSGELTVFGSLEPAVTMLRELLADRDILMVIDDVWDPAHLEPFLQGGPYCARLITTRNLDSLPERCRDVKVDSMQSIEAVRLLGAGLTEDTESQITALAERVGNWPLLLGIMKGVLQGRIKTAQQPQGEAIAYLNKALDKRGLDAFDQSNTQARNRAVALTVDVGLERLTKSERDRFEELSVFPEDVEIPLSTVSTLWQVTGGLDGFDAEELCVRLHRQSLLQTLNLETRYIGLHDVMRVYLRTALAKRVDPTVVQGELVDAWGDPYKLPNSYAWRWYAYSMDGANRPAELRELLLEPKWLHAKLIATDVASLIADFDYQPEDECLRLLQQAIRLSSGVLARDPGQFASQILGRLLEYQDIPEIGLFSSKVAECTRNLWLRPLRATLHPPATSLLRTLEGHSGPVWGVALSRDGTIAVSASDDKTLKVWDVKRGLELRTLKGHSGPVRDVALSKDKQLAVSASDDKTLRVWDVKKGLELRSLEGHAGPVRDVALSNDSKIALSASDDKTLKVWDVAAGLELRTLEGHTDAVVTVAMSEECGLAISGSHDSTLRVWELNSWRLLRTLKAIASVDSVALSRDGRLAAYSTRERCFIPGEGSYAIVPRIEDAETGKTIRCFAGQRARVNAVTLTSDSQFMFTASEDRKVRIFKVDSGLQIGTLTDHSSDVTGVALSENGLTAASASSDRSLKIWDLTRREALREIPQHSGVVTGVAISRDGRIAISGSMDGTVLVWQVKVGAAPRTLTHTAVAKAPVFGVVFSENGRLAVSACLDGRLRLWTLESGGMRLLDSWKGHTYSCIACSEDGHTAVVGSLRKTVLVWDLTRRCEVQTLQSHTGYVLGVALSGDAKLAISASADWTLKLWDLAHGRELRTLLGHSAEVNGVALSRDGRLAVSASSDKTLRVWETDSGREVGILQGHSGAVLGVALSRDGSMAVSASIDKSVRVWDVRSGNSVGQFVCDGPARCCALDEVHAVIVAGEEGGRVHFLRLEEPGHRC